MASIYCLLFGEGQRRPPRSAHPSPHKYVSLKHAPALCRSVSFYGPCAPRARVSMPLFGNNPVRPSFFLLVCLSARQPPAPVPEAVLRSWLVVVPPDMTHLMCVCCAGKPTAIKPLCLDSEAGRPIDSRRRRAA